MAISERTKSAMQSNRKTVENLRDQYRVACAAACDLERQLNLAEARERELLEDLYTEVVGE